MMSGWEKWNDPDRELHELHEFHRRLLAEDFRHARRVRWALYICAIAGGLIVWWIFR